MATVPVPQVYHRATHQTKKMSLAINQCVYNQIQNYSITRQSPRPYASQAVIFLVTRAFDVAVSAAAASAAAAAGAHVAHQPLTAAILHAAVVGGVVKSGAMAFAGILCIGPLNSPVAVLPLLLSSAFATNVLVVAAVSNRLLGHVPTELLVAAVVASVPLSLCFAYYYGAFRVPITLASIGIDALGAYAFVRMADNLGYYVCSPSVAASAGAVFGTVSSVAVTTLSCCVIGRRRTLMSNSYNEGMSISGTAHASCCGSRIHISSTTSGGRSDSGGNEWSSSITTGLVYNTAHGLGMMWDAGSVQGHLGWFTWSSHDNTVTNTSTSSTRITFNR